MLDLIQKQPLRVRRNVVFFLSGLCVGFTKCVFAQGDLNWQAYLACFVLGYFSVAIVSFVAMALVIYVLDIDIRQEHERLYIIIGLTLIVVSFLMLIGHTLQDVGLDDPSE